MSGRRELHLPYGTPVWLGLLGLALVLRAYHLPGFVVNNDEGHWLLYTLHPQLLFEPLRNSYPRPDILFPLLVFLPLKLFGPNEISLRLWPVLFGTLSLLPLAWVIFEITGDRRASLFAAVLLAVLPLHVYFSAQGVPDVIALFFALCALVFLLRARQTDGLDNFVWMTVFLALALLTKATALYFWGFLAFTGVFLFRTGRQRYLFYAALALATLPFILVTVVILLQSTTMSFFREPGITETFGFSFARLDLEIRYLVSFYNVLLLVATVAAVITIWRAGRGLPVDRQLLIWLVPLANLFITPFFRVGRIELLWLIPSLCLFAVVLLNALSRLLAWAGIGVVASVLLIGCLWGVPLPNPGRARAAVDYTASVLDRPSHWPSRDAAHWLLTHTSSADAILFTAYTFTDPLLLDVSRSRHVFPNAGSNWALLRDPSNRIKYIVFTQDYRGYAPYLAAYADAHFTLPADAQFPNYTVYDCQKYDRFVAYPDAYNSASQYVQRGMDFLQQHQLDHAAEAFEKAIEVDPNQPVAGANLALLYYQLGRQADGIAQCERNISRNIDLASSYGVLGQIREQQGNLVVAEAAYEESLKSDPKNRVTLQLLANLKARSPSSTTLPTP